MATKSFPLNGNKTVSVVVGCSTCAGSCSGGCTGSCTGSCGNTCGDSCESGDSPCAMGASD